MRSKSGFTLVELLVAIVIGLLITATLGSILVNILSSDSSQTARSEVEQDVQSTVSFIMSDLSQASYVYDGNCMQGQGSASSSNSTNFCPGLVNHIPSLGTGITPVLAMWILEPVPYYGTTTQIPTSCSGLGALQQDCSSLQSSRRAYSLIVYYLDTTTNSQFGGLARLRRYVLRKYTTLTSSSMSITTGYVDPFPNDSKIALFRRWPYDGADSATNQQSSLPSNNLSLAPVVADYIDANWTGVAATPIACRTNPDYIRTPLTSSANSFYACVLNKSDSTTGTQSPGKNTSTFVYLRGNTQGKSGFTISTGTQVRPVVTAIVLSKGVSDNDPY
ncbi:prepilin-type N-terminal cleavage/methylation domain-containing protein [Thermosynechococcaceae cyanobacterium BACA0444]|uniref:Prepilin-type N-terminal cleavage/methylation domain-containing protein n=1 Tax=Pseudocalidococcus azoricus BACA0444 TaxID=2918990 RepID=A0AAE4JWY3_9CYAN|nr:prepilin-type N-terminal cleavage/methylation domain-containing protein [Pseudocalidococcus azoricus]MDS3860623.1 prepilin-type N-terminal cleavage/methylation domain-containing protein [Pseudocalidococcus azoricus BACA0444]